MGGGVLVWDGTGRAEPAAKCTAGAGIPAWEACYEPGLGPADRAGPPPDQASSGPNGS